MKILLVVSLLVCVAFAIVEEEADTTKEIYNGAWHENGERIVTFGSSRYGFNYDNFLIKIII